MVVLQYVFFCPTVLHVGPCSSVSKAIVSGLTFPIRPGPLRHRLPLSSLHVLESPPAKLSKMVHIFFFIQGVKDGVKSRHIWLCPTCKNPKPPANPAPSAPFSLRRPCREAPTALPDRLSPKHERKGTDKTQQNDGLQLETTVFFWATTWKKKLCSVYGCLWQKESVPHKNGWNWTSAVPSSTKTTSPWSCPEQR